jgi:RimJ/RimL family protein N-acetyltransferase
MDFGSPNLADDLIVLRRWNEHDVDYLVDTLGSEPDISRWTRVPWPYERRHAEDFLALEQRGWEAGTDAVFAITDAATGAPCGAVGIHRLGGRTVRRSAFLPDEIGYWLAASGRGCGRATRAVALVTGWVLGPLGCRRVNLQVADGNDSSRRVAERAGFRYVGLVPAAQLDDDDRSFHRYVREAA